MVGRDDPIAPPKAKRQDNLRCKAVVQRNVGSFKYDGTLQRETHNAFASLCVSYKAIPTASLETRREVFFFVPIAKWRTELKHATCQSVPQVECNGNSAEEMAEVKWTKHQVN